MTPSEFDAHCRLLESAHPNLRQTSRYRGVHDNERVGGAPGSKHLIGMATDYGAATMGELYEAQETANRLGFWTIVHDKGSGSHLHVQGLAPGPLPEWWRAKFGG